MPSKQLIPWIISGLGLGIIVLFLIKLDYSFSEIQSAEDLRLSVRNFQISIWCGWVLMTSAATYYQWTQKEYTLFIVDYLTVLISFVFLRYYLGLGEEKNLWTLGDTFKTGANYMTMRNALLMFFMTAFVQAAIWLFSSKWHRK